MSRDDLHFTPIGPIVGTVLGWQVRHTANGEEGYAIQRITERQWRWLHMKKVEFYRKRLAEIAKDLDEEANDTGYMPEIRQMLHQMQVYVAQAAAVGEPVTAGAAF